MLVSPPSRVNPAKGHGNIAYSLSFFSQSLMLELNTARRAYRSKMPESSSANALK